MKQFSFKLEKLQKAEWFDPLRNKQDVIVLLMNSIKYMLISDPVPENENPGELILRVDKMSRLFFRSDEKCFSISFPFTVGTSGDSLTFHSKFIDVIDNKITSDVLSVLSNQSCFDSECIYDFFTPLLDLVDEEPTFWSFVLELFLYEDGYIRYDHDKRRANGDLHPEHHYDLFYSSKATVKVGLRAKLSIEKMIDFMRADTNCHYIQ